MELIKQPSFETCGQACIAMITGKDINVLINNKGLPDPEIYLKKNSSFCIISIQRNQNRKIRISKKNPKPYKYSILTVHVNGGYTHWVLFYNDKYYDPEFGLIEDEYTYGKITSFLEIYED